ncbi:MAG: hypothetical protein HC808_20055 [Candidatus Competibacteraceae bacterium]|nr:hypothetical protein [Candidatus Competibacteraceae bacterium]
MPISFIGLRGSNAALDQLTVQLGVLYVQVPLEGGGYTMDHTASMLLFDPDLQLVGLLGQTLSDTALATAYRDIRQFIDAQSGRRQ